MYLDDLCWVEKSYAIELQYLCAYKLDGSLNLSHHFCYVEGNLIPGTPTKGLIPDPPCQETHITPTAPRQEDQSPDFNLPIARDQSFNQPGGELGGLPHLQKAVEISWSRIQH